LASSFHYSQQISNSYLHATKVIKAQTVWELKLKVNDQLEKWNAQEARQRERDRINNARENERARVDNLKRQTEKKNMQAQQERTEYECILAATLKVNDALDWNQMLRTVPFRTFSFQTKEPTIDAYYRGLDVPKKKFIEHLVPPVRKRRLRLEQAATKAYQKELASYHQTLQAAMSAYKQEKAAYLQEQKKYNDEIYGWKSLFEHGDGLAIEKYMRVVLANSHYPDHIAADSELSYEITSKTVVIDFILPSPDDIPDIEGYKFVATRKAIDPIPMKQKVKAALYELVIQQIALRTIHELFEGMYIKELLNAVVFNGWVNGVNKATGKDYNACILSVQANRQVFEAIDLSRVDPKECLRELKALSAGPLSSLAPVKPIMALNREDKRFISSVDVMDAMDEDTNLATMPWESFEHLVRQLFAQIFSKDGAEVRVTQTSRDGGVDAIAFDPDPIRGGKYVIQAKRYNNVVHVSACRDLYGTMINEGAVKGILVTTSYYGSDSREFVKDKPITLIDGANLTYMLNEYGYNFHIKLKES